MTSTEGGNVKEMKVEGLEVHPFNLDIYGEPDAGLAENIDNFGLQTPIKVDPEGRILSGARRWTAVKKLGWDTIPAEVPDVDWEDDRAIQLYVLIANAYRKQKTSYQQKREADAYSRLLESGDMSREQAAKLARDQGTLPRGVDPEKVSTRGADEARRSKAKYDSELAARAAGLSPNTYRRYRYLTDGGAESDIDEALEAREIDPDQAEKIRAEAREMSEKVKRDEVGVRTADNRVRDRIREAKREHTLTPEQRADREAAEAVSEVRKKGKAYVAALERLFMDHREHLDGQMALNLASTFHEIRGLLVEQLPRGFLTDDAPDELEDSDAMEVRSEVVA